MEKKSIFLLIFICYFTFSFAQNNIYSIQKKSTLKSGTIYYTKKVKFKSMDDQPLSRAFKNKSFIQHSELHFNSFESFYKLAQRGMDKGIPQQEKSSFGGRKRGFSSTTSPVDDKGTVFYRNFKTKELFFRVIKMGVLQPYVVKDNWIPLKWTILKNHKTILGYDCEKAIAKFRGRIYTAWFTKQIPLPYGPWKLFGLPGLILKEYDREGNGVTVQRVCYPCAQKKGLIHKPKEKLTRTIKEHVYFRDHLVKMYDRKIMKNAKKIGKGDRVRFDSKSMATPTQIKKNRQDSPEIIYEWEKFPGDTPNPYKNDSIQEPDQNMFPKEMQVKK